MPLPPFPIGAHCFFFLISNHAERAIPPCFAYAFEGVVREETGIQTFELTSTLIGRCKANVLVHRYFTGLEHTPGVSMKSTQVFLNEASDPQENSMYGEKWPW